MSNKYFPSDKDTWQWQYANLSDTTDIVNMAESLFQNEIENIFTPDPALFAHNIDIAITQQYHYKHITQIMVARHKHTQKLMAWSWIGRGNTTTYAKEEMAEARFIHTDLSLSARTRITLVAQTLQHWIVWCYNYGIPVLVSTSIRQEQQAFLKLHKDLGFILRGSIAYKKIEEKK